MKKNFNYYKIFNNQKSIIMSKEVINYRGIDIEIIPDDNAQSPDDWLNDDTFLVYDHRDFSVKREGFEPREIHEARQEGKHKLYDGYWVFPVDAYIHSGVALSLANETNFPDRRWDVSTTGFALVKRQKGWTWTEAKARKVARSIVDEWNDYLSGNVYGWSVAKTGDSVWGYYGDPEKSGCLDEAKYNVDAYIEEQRKSHWQQLKTWIKNRVPLMYRRPINDVLTN